MIDDAIIKKAYKQLEAIVKMHREYDRDILLASIILALITNGNSEVTK